MIQGNCHHWDCRRCGIVQAKKAYGRIVVGARELAARGYGLHFVTLTSRGRDCTLQEAEANFLLWTNRLLTAWRTRVKRAGNGAWEYAAVTERQKRGHPHLHLLTIATVGDEKEARRWRMVPNGDGGKRRDYYNTLRSDWLEQRIESAGLGRQYDMQVVKEPEALSRYLAKYLFKDTAFTQWPAHWRRVRYSQGWPKLPERAPSDAQWYPVITGQDWAALSRMTGRIRLLGSDADVASVQARYTGIVVHSGAQVGL